MAKAKYLSFKQDGKKYNLYDLPDGFVIEDDVNLSGKELTELPNLSKVIVKGDFDCSYNKLTSLKGCPQKVTGGFYCRKNKLTSLEGAPQEVGGKFICSENKLTQIIGHPEIIRGDFNCSNNQIVDLFIDIKYLGGKFDCRDNPIQRLGFKGICTLYLTKNGKSQYFCTKGFSLFNLYDLPDDFVIEGNLDLSDEDLDELPNLSKVVIKGNFDCSRNGLGSLKGCPQKVGGDFDCRCNELTSLEGCPQEVGGDFSCCLNELTSLEGSPKEIAGNFDCNYNQLTSLEGCPQKVGGDFDCSYNQLTSLEGCPQKVGGDFDCRKNNLVSLESIPNGINGEFLCDDENNNDENLENNDELTPEQITELEQYPNLKQAIESYYGWGGFLATKMTSLGVWFRTQCQKNDLNPIEVFGWKYDENFDYDEYHEDEEAHPEWDYTTEYADNFVYSGHNSRWRVVEEYIDIQSARNIVYYALKIAREYGDIDLSEHIKGKTRS